MIVRDEQDNLPGCIASVGDTVDELVVVDTGSQDGTPEVARRLGAQVHRFQWIDDFSAARNFSIRKANGRYILWLDADDRLSPMAVERLCRLKTYLQQADGREAFYFIVRNVGYRGAGSEFLQLRLFPNVPGARFEGRIHEQIYHVLQGMGVRLTRTDIFIDHLGYGDHEGQEEKAARNLAILLEEVARDPGNPYLRFHLANTYSVMGRHAEAIEQYERVQSTPDLEERCPGTLPRVLLEMGSTYLKMGVVQEAEAVFRRHHEAYPESWTGKFVLAELLVQQERWWEAKSLLSGIDAEEPASEIFPLPLDEMRFRIPFFLGQCRAAEGDVQGAIADLERALSLRPQEPAVLGLSGRLRLMQGEAETAARDLESAVACGGGSAELLCNLGLAYKRSGLAERALEAYRQALALDPGHPDTRVNLSTLLVQLDRAEEAKGHLMEVLRHEGDWLDIRLLLARILWSQGEVDPFVAVLDDLMRILGLERNRTLQSIQDLVALLGEMADALSLRGRQKEAAMARQMEKNIQSEFLQSQQSSAS
jgi:tetratricopeptide (TPR) repeat protein